MSTTNTTTLADAERREIVRAWPWPVQPAGQVGGLSEVIAAVERILADRLATAAEHAIECERIGMDEIEKRLTAEAERDAARREERMRAEDHARAWAKIRRVEALADDWDAPLGDYQWFAAQIRAALDADA